MHDIFDIQQDSIIKNKILLEKRLPLNSSDEEENGIYFSQNVKCKKLKTNDGIRLGSNGRREILGNTIAVNIISGQKDNNLMSVVISSEDNDSQRKDSSSI